MHAPPSRAWDIQQRLDEHFMADIGVGVCTPEPPWWWRNLDVLGSLAILGWTWPFHNPDADEDDGVHPIMVPYCPQIIDGLTSELGHEELDAYLSLVELVVDLHIAYWFEVPDDDDRQRASTPSCGRTSRSSTGCSTRVSRWRTSGSPCGASAGTEPLAPSRRRRTGGSRHRAWSTQTDGVGETRAMTDAAGGSGPAHVDLVALLGDPDAELARCAAQHWWATTDDPRGRRLPIVLSWEETRQTLNDRRLSPRSFTEDMVANGLDPATAAQLTPLFSRHGDEHRRMRAVLSKAFTPKQVERLRPAAHAVADRLADGIAEAGDTCEFVSAFAERLPPEVFATLFGLPVEDRDRLGRWAGAIAPAFSLLMRPEQVAGVEAAAAELREYCAERMAAARAHPGDDLVTRLVEAEVDGHRLSDEDVVAMISGFVFAGSETTRSQLTAAVMLFAEYPEDWDRLAADPDLVPNAVEELLRLRGIVRGLTRRAEEPFAHGDLDVDEGGRLFVSFQAANHDPQRFDEPLSFVVDRPDANAHVTFGWGPHLCVGAGLARLELTEGLRVLTSRFHAPVVEEAGEAGAMGAPVSLRVRLAPR